MEIREILNLLEGLEEGRRLYRQEGSLEKWTKDAESAGHRVVHHDGRKDPNSTHHAIDQKGNIVGKFFNATYVNNKRGFLHTEGVSEGSGKNVVKSIKVGNFRHDLVDTGMGWQVRVYNGDELYDTGLSKNSEQKGLAALEDAVAYTEKQTRTKRQGVSEGEKKPYPKTWHDVDPKLGKQVDKMSQAEKVKKGFAHPDTLKKQGVSEGISVVDQDYDLDQIVLTLDIEGRRVLFTYTDYDEDFANAERKDVFDQLMRKDWYKGLDHPTRMEILDAAYRAIRGLDPQPYEPTVGDEPMDVGDKLDEQQVDEEDPVARISRLHQELHRR